MHVHKGAVEILKMEEVLYENNKSCVTRRGDTVIKEYPAGRQAIAQLEFDAARSILGLGSEPGLFEQAQSVRRVLCPIQVCLSFFFFSLNA